MHEYVIIGGGIIGLATAMAVGNKYPKARILVLKKEQDLAQQQTGRNSGVIHSGIYYNPRSLKARLAREGNRSMVEFCREHDIKREVCGKVIVATNASELPLLDSLFTGASRRKKFGKCRNGNSISDLIAFILPTNNFIE